MEAKSTVYAETRSNYLNDVMSMDWTKLRNLHLIGVHEDRISIPFFNKVLHVSHDGIKDNHGMDASFPESVVVLKYLLMYTDKIDTDTSWVSFRDFKDSGPLTVYFSDNCEKRLQKTFGLEPEKLKGACLALGGYIPAHDLSHDIVMAFDALPRLSIFLLFNCAEDDFPAACSVLFEKRAEQILDPESLAILAVILAEKLCHPFT
jgi:hypothetical protein